MISVKILSFDFAMVKEIGMSCVLHVVGFELVSYKTLMSESTTDWASSQQTTLLKFLPKELGIPQHPSYFFTAHHSPYTPSSSSSSSEALQMANTTVSGSGLPSFQPCPSQGSQSIYISNLRHCSFLFCFPYLCQLNFCL